jgi:hypothetical protein
MRILLTTGFLIGLLALSAFAADVTGKWVAEMPGRDGQTHEVTFNLKTDGSTLSGTVSGPQGDTEITDGKIDGDQVSFAQVMDFNGNQVKVLYKGAISGDQITFTRSHEGGHGGGHGRGGHGGGPQQFTAKRAS